ncbi:MAG: hypothetical protein V4530_08175 [Pseudomonadota bacterium]
MTKRPSAIVWFERLYILSIILSVAGTAGNWSELTSVEGDDGAILGAIGTIVVGVVYFADFLLWLFIMRRRSKLARWLLAIVTIVAVPLELANPDSRPWDIWSTLLIIEITVSFAALVSLFAPGARRWFDGTPDNLAETFS